MMKLINIKIINQKHKQKIEVQASIYQSIILKRICYEQKKFSFFLKGSGFENISELITTSLLER